MGKVGAARQKARAQGAQVGAVTVDANALDHHPHHVLVQAGGRALLAGGGAVQTVLNAGLHFGRKIIDCVLRYVNCNEFNADQFR